MDYRWFVVRNLFRHAAPRLNQWHGNAGALCDFFLYNYWRGFFGTQPYDSIIGKSIASTGKPAWSTLYSQNVVG